MAGAAHWHSYDGTTVLESEEEDTAATNRFIAEGPHHSLRLQSAARHDRAGIDLSPETSVIQRHWRRVRNFFVFTFVSVEFAIRTT